MLVDFTVRNFGPFRDEVTLSLIASSRKDETGPVISSGPFSSGLLKAAVIFGPNASGKSYLFDAIRFLKIITSEARAEGTRIPGFIPFVFIEEASLTPTTMEIRMVLDGILYDYSISYTSSGIQKESLYHSPNGRRTLVFSRGDKENNVDEAIMDRVSASTSYLFMASTFNDKVCTIVFRGIQDIEVISQGHMIDIERTYRMAEEDPEMRRMLLSALDAADLGISDYRGVEIPVRNADGSVGDESRIDIRMIHDYPDADRGMVERGLSILSESNGTIEMFSMMGPIGMALRKGGTIFIDEFGTDLHPMLSRWLVQLFNTCENDNGAQLIVNTHNLELMDITNLLRRDQIWFTNKDRRTGSSTLYSLIDFKGVRKGSNVRGDYLVGRFDAVPKIVGVLRL